MTKTTNKETNKKQWHCKVTFVKNPPVYLREFYQRHFADRFKEKDRDWKDGIYLSWPSL